MLTGFYGNAPPGTCCSSIALRWLGEERQNSPDDPPKTTKQPEPTKPGEHRQPFTARGPSQNSWNGVSKSHGTVRLGTTPIRRGAQMTLRIARPTRRRFVESSHWTEALRAKDIDRLWSHTPPTSCRSTSRPRLQHRESCAGSWRSGSGRGGSNPRTRSRHLTIAVGGDVAFSHSLNRMSGTRTTGEEIDVWLRATVLRRIDGFWRVAHRAGVPFPSTWMGASGPRWTSRPSPCESGSSAYDRSWTLRQPSPPSIRAALSFRTILVRNTAWPTALLPA